VPDARLRALADRAAIHDVVLRYARAVDRRDWATVATCFTPDAETDYGDFHRGPVDGLLRALADTLPRFDWTMHVIGNHYVDLAAVTAETETYAVCFHRRGNESVTVGMRYLDGFVRTPDGWRIRRRAAPFVWLRRESVPA
jgi:ketosteroid isomerase-like protein